MDFHFGNDRPIYLQLASAIREEILSGRLETGQKLPSVRDLAKDARVNPNTVTKALSELEKEGLIETRRTSGKFVSLPSGKARKELEKEAAAKIQGLVQELVHLGFSADEIETMFREVFHERF